MKLFNKKESNLDEYHELQLLKIEHNGCWLAFWGLIISMAVQLIAFGYEEGSKMFLGEWVIFMVLCLYLFIAMKKNNIWDRRLKPNFKTNLIVSAITGVVVCVIITLVIFRNYPDFLLVSIASGIFVGVFTFFLCLIALSFEARSYKKMLEKLEAEPSEEINE